MRSIFWTTISWICYWMLRQRGAIPWREKDFLYSFSPVCADWFHEPGGGKPAAAASGPFWHGGGCEAETDVDKQVQIIENRMAYEKIRGISVEVQRVWGRAFEGSAEAREFLPTGACPKGAVKAGGTDLRLPTALTAIRRISE